MKPLVIVSLLFFLCAAASCGGAQGAEDGPASPTGTWVGDFGPAFYDRNTISLELKWDGNQLTGLVKPGVAGARMYRNFEGFPIEKASFDPQTGVIKFEALYQPR